MLWLLCVEKSLFLTNELSELSFSCAVPGRRICPAVLAMVHGTKSPNRPRAPERHHPQTLLVAARLLCDYRSAGDIQSVMPPSTRFTRGTRAAPRGVLRPLVVSSCAQSSVKRHGVQ